MDESAQKNITSAYRAMQSGFLTKSEYQKNVVSNRGEVSANQSELKSSDALVSKNTPTLQSGLKKLTADAGRNKSTMIQSGVSLDEPLEKIRIQKLLDTDVLFKESKAGTRNSGKLKEKTPEGYYDFTGNLKEETKKQKELWGPKTDFSVTNFENNYELLNNDEKTMLTLKMQKYLNQQEYNDLTEFPLKEDGILGSKTKEAFQAYKQNETDWDSSSLSKGQKQIVDSDNINIASQKSSNFAGSVMQQLMTLKSYYDDAYKFKDKKKMAQYAEIGKFLKAVMRETVQYQDNSSPHRKLIDDFLDYDKNTTEPSYAKSSATSKALLSSALSSVKTVGSMSQSADAIDSVNRVKGLNERMIKYVISKIAENVQNNLYKFRC